MSALRLLRSPNKPYETELEIPTSVSPRARRLHISGLAHVKMMNEGEINLLNDLREMDETKSFEEFGSPNLSAYAIKWLKVTEAVAYNLIAIMRRGRQVPELIQAIKDGAITTSAARKITPVINSENKNEWLELASTSSVRVVEKAVATECPKAAVKEQSRYVTSERLNWQLGVSEEFLETLKELKDLKSQQVGAAVDSEDALLSAMKNEIARISPLEKAKRARMREEKKQKANSKPDVEFVRSVVTEMKPESTRSTSRERFSAATKHAVNLRDGHRCTEKSKTGERCTQTRWLDIHHVIEVQNGGDNSVENLRTVCGAHHRKLHRETSHLSRDRR